MISKKYIAIRISIKIEEALYEKNILIKAFKTAIILANAKLMVKKIYIYRF